MTYDVVIAGAGIAGCTSAILLGRTGLRVALLERHRSAETHKTLCGHLIMPGTLPMLRRTGLLEHLVDAGATVDQLHFDMGRGWLPELPDIPPALSIRRQTLDPLLRSLAEATPGVELLLGTSVTGLVVDGRTVTGVRARDGAGEHEIRARLVVAADGNPSRVAGMAGVSEDRSPNNRFLFWAYYRGARLRGPGLFQIWRRSPNVTIALRTDDDVVMIGAFMHKDQLPLFEDDRHGMLEQLVSAMPDAPDLAGAERISKVIGTTDYPCIKRDPTPRPGLVLAGDAAISMDPLPAVGCGWAFRGGEWLADAFAPALLGSASMRRAAARYRRALRFVEGHDKLARQTALAAPPTRLEQLIESAATHDPVIAWRMRAFGSRLIPASGLLRPSTVGRALLAQRKVRRGEAHEARMKEGVA